MNTPAYPSYRPSGVAWLGDVPSTWKASRVGVALTERKQNVSDRDFAPLSVTKDGVVPQLDHAAKTDNGDTRKRVEPGDFVINSRSDRKGSAGLSHLRGSVSQISIVLTPRGVEPRFVHHLFRSQPFQEEFYRFGSGIVADLWSTRFSNMRQISLALPPLEEQRQIADYLDAQTAKIDALIGKQEQLIETLAERRQAVISRAVTKGLDPNAPMKDSGVEWLGAVPTNWEVGNIRRFATMRTGHTPSRSNPDYWENCDIPWFTLADVRQLRRGARYLGETASKISELGLANSAADLLPAGTVVLSRTASVGFTGIMPVPMATSQDYWNWMCSIALNPTFLWYQFLAMRPYLMSLVRGSTHKTIYQSDAAGLSISAPPIEEQLEIVAYLDSETAKIDALCAKTREMIGVLKERRQALISAAVTGKIDVRGLT